MVSAAGGHHFVIEKTQFPKLERALSVALRASHWMGAEARIFWLRDSVFAATPYAYIGLAIDLELRPERITKDTPDCFAISRAAAKKLIHELRSPHAHFLERIRLLWTPDAVLFRLDYNRESDIEKPAFESRYKGPWLPRLTPREYYARLIDSPLYVECDLPINSMLEKMQRNESSGYITFEEVSETVPTISVSRSLLLAFLHAAKDIAQSDTFKLNCHGKERAITCRAGDAIAVLAAI
jgi:hypothetical protein